MAAETFDLFVPEMDTKVIEKQAKELGKILKDIANDRSGSPQIEKMQQQLEKLYEMQQRLEQKRISLGVSETDPVYLEELGKIEEKYKQIAVQYTNLKKQEAFKAGQESAEAFKQGLVGLLRLFPQIGGHLSKAFNKIKGLIKIPDLSGKLKGATSNLRRVLMLVGGIALGVRGLQSIINKLRTSVLAGFRDVYNQDKEFKTQMDTIKQKILDIQVALAESLMPVIQLALPYIKQILDWILQLLGTLKRFISTVTGIAEYTKAIKGLGGAAQKANKQLSKLDELNNLTSGGGNGLTPNDSSIGSPDQIKDWFTFTRNIIDEIEKALRAIPWDTIYKKAEKFGQQVGLVLDAIFKPSFWNAVGETVGGIFNTLLHFYNALGNSLWFDEIGKSIFQGITGLLDKFDFGLLKSTIEVWADGLWTIIKTVLTERGENGETLAERLVRMLTEGLRNVDWQKIFAMIHDIGNTLATTLNQLINPQLALEIGKTLGNSLMSIVEFAIAFFGEGGLDWENLGDTIANAINGIFESFDGKRAAKAVNSIFQGVITAVKKLIKSTNWDEIKKDIRDLIANTDWKSVLTVLSVVVLPELFAIVKDIFIAVWNLVKVPLLHFLQTTVWPEIVSFFSTIFANPIGFFNTTILPFIETVGAAIIAALGGFQIGNGLGETVALLFGDTELAEEYENSSLMALMGVDMDLWEESWFETFDDIKDGWGMIIDDFKNNPLSAILISTGDGNIVKEKAKEVFDKVIDSWEEFSDTIFSACKLWFQDNIEPFFHKETWDTLVQPIWDSITNIWTNVTEWWNTNIVAWWDKNVVPWFTLEKWTGIVTNILNAVSTVWNDTVTWWSTNLTTWWTDYVEPWFTLEKWTGLLQNIETAFDGAFRGAANVAINMINKVLEAVEGLINNGAVQGLNWIIEKANAFENVNIPTISGLFTLPKIPALASGAVIPPSMGEFIAKLGDNNSQTEIVSPLDTMKEAVIQAMQEGGFGGSGEIHIHVDLEGREIAKAMVKQNEIFKKSTGRPMFA